MSITMQILIYCASMLLVFLIGGAFVYWMSERSG